MKHIRWKESSEYRVVSIATQQREPLRIVLGVLSLYSMSGDASGKPTPSYKKILQSKDKAVSEAKQSIERSGREHLIKGGKKKSFSLKNA